MYVIFLTLAIIGFILLIKFIDWIKEYYLTKYNYPIYKIQVLLVLFFFSILLFVFLMGLDTSVSTDNTIAALVIRLIVWCSVLAYNINKTSIPAGIFITIYQTIISVLIFVLILYLWISYSGKHKRRS